MMYHQSGISRNTCWAWKTPIEAEQGCQLSLRRELWEVKSPDTGDINFLVVVEGSSSSKVPELGAQGTCKF